MAVVQTWLKTDLKKPVHVKQIGGNLFSADNGANLIGVEVVEDGSPATLSGSVFGYVVRADGATVVVNGTLSENKATVTLPASCYTVVGPISIVIKVGTTTVGACTGYVYRSSTDEFIDPGHVVPSLQELLAQIQNCIDATAGANTAAGTANTAAQTANTAAQNVGSIVARPYSASSTYAAGDYCTNNGNLYKANQDISTAEEWTASHWTPIVVGDEVAGLKSAIGTVPEGKNLQGEVDELQTVKAEKDGAYEDLTAGNAEYLLSDRGETDVAPYVFRKTGGAKKAYGRELLKKIVGGTVAWNQLVQNVSDSSEVYGITRESVGNGGLRVHGTCTNSTSFTVTSAYNIIAGHKVMITFGNVSLPSGARILNGTVPDKANYVIQNISASQSTSYDIYIASGTVIDVVIYPQAFDFTAMFGSTVADAIYAMEQATAGSGVAFFRSLFPKDYYAYDAGSLQSVQAKEHRLTGFNQWDEETEAGDINTSTGLPQADNGYVRSKNFNKCIGNTAYYGYDKLHGQLIAYFYDDEKNYLGYFAATNRVFTSPVNAKYFKVRMLNNSSYPYSNNKVCVSFSDSSKNGNYEPYQVHTYPLDADITLRGIPKWDSTNGLYYDGDEYLPDGKVNRKYGIVDLGALTWTYFSTKGHLYFRANLVNPKRAQNGSMLANLLCAPYTNSTGNNVYANTADKLIAIPGDNDIVMITNFTYTDAATFKTAMSGVYLVYELATPTTEQADGYRELEICNGNGTEEFVDAGVTATTPTRDVSVPVGTETFYPIDVVAYIEELTNPDHDMVADALIPSGKYFMVGNSLYLSTSQIQAGATIIPGSNCTAKTLAEALNELNA